MLVLDQIQKFLGCEVIQYAHKKSNAQHPVYTVTNVNLGREYIPKEWTKKVYSMPVY